MGMKAKPKPAADSRTDPAVESFLRELEHPLKEAVVALRTIIRGVSPAITEGIKWNAPSFRTADDFATMNLRGKPGEERLWLILHTGAKVKATAKTGLEIADPSGLLKWLAKDRAVVTFQDLKDVRARRAALESVIRQWVAMV